jgi:hypothetical protein
MTIQRWVLAGVCLWGTQSLARCEEPKAQSIKVLALQPDGKPAGNLAQRDWTLKIAGKEVSVKEVLPPSEVSKRPVKWTIVLMPVWDPKVRQITLVSVANFLKGLPASDSALIVMQGEKGLQCLTPGFTRRPTLWASALERAITEFRAGLRSNTLTFTLPASPTAEPAEEKKPIQALLDQLGSIEMKRQMEDARSHRSFKEDYVEARTGLREVPGARFEKLKGWTRTVVSTLSSLDALAQAVANEPGEKQVIVFSRNEVDDLGSPLWLRDQGQIEVADMIASVRQAISKTRDNFALAGVTFHLVSGAGLGYSGALGEVAQATGGFSLFFQQSMPERLGQALESWVNRYEISFQWPAEAKRPAPLEVSASGANLRLFAPAMH